jgi:glycosyltransferase involved in cell wall biosynthesis
VTSVHLVVPSGIDDPARPSGGNTYDRRIGHELAATGWSVHEHVAPGPWPNPDVAAREDLAAVISGIPDGAVVLVDGLVGSPSADVLVPHAGRLRLVVLVHMPLGVGASDDPIEASERALLSAATAVVTTSQWTRHRLLDLYALRPDRLHVAEPGVDPAALATGTAGGGRLLCVAAVTPVKGHDLLLAALATVKDLIWRCVCVGALDRDACFAETVRRQAWDTGIGDRVEFVGPRVGDDLDLAYAASDLLVVGSRAETYAMVVTEALARGLPVVAASVGGLPEALGEAPDGSRPGLLATPEDPQALGAALRRWLVDEDLRGRLRQAARKRRTGLPDWSATTGRVARALTAAEA